MFWICGPLSQDKDLLLDPETGPIVDAWTKTVAPALVI